MANLAEVNQKVQRLLTDYVGSVSLVGDVYKFEYESTACIVRVQELENGKIAVIVSAPVGIGIPVTPDLHKYVAENTDRYIFGHLGMQVDDDGTALVVFTHSLLGDFLDPDELKVAVGSVVNTADNLDDEVVAKFGGKRYADD